MYIVTSKPARRMDENCQNYQSLDSGSFCGCVIGGDGTFEFVGEHLVDFAQSG